MRVRSWKKDAQGIYPKMPDRFREAITCAQQQCFDGRHVLNVRPDPYDFRDLSYTPSLVAIRPHVEPPPWPATLVRRQGGEGACTGHALAAVIDIQHATRSMSFGKAVKPTDFQPVSARMLYEMAKAYDGLPNDWLPGSTLRGALKGFFHNGVCGEPDAPYEANEPGWRLLIDMAKSARNCGLGSYYRLGNTIYDYHAALNEVGSIYCSAMVHEGWEFSRVKANNGRIALMKQAGEIELVGGHAFAIVGYDQDGFIVLNSWGRNWGRYQDRPGMAHWSYEDWRLHMLDAWVLRLQAPSAKTFHLSGGWHELRDSFLGQGRVTTPRIEINGHYIHVAKGKTVRAGAYLSDDRSIKETAAFLTDSEKAEEYKHLVFIADSGLEPLDVMAQRAAVVTAYMKAKGVYPIFLSWQSDFLVRLHDLLGPQADRLAAICGQEKKLLASMIEGFASNYLKPIWEEMESDAVRAVFSKRRYGLTDGVTRLQGDLWRSVRTLWNAVNQREDVSVHFAAHSTGAILLGYLFAKATDEGFLPQERGPSGGMNASRAPIRSLSLLAPACGRDFFGKHYLSVRRALRAEKKRTSIFALSKDWEDTDSVGPYHGSLLKLAAAAFTDDQPLGLDDPDHSVGGTAADMRLAEHNSEHSDSRTHRAFVEDPKTLNSVLDEILGPGRKERS
jgi:hypothetical protein